MTKVSIYDAYVSNEYYNIFYVTVCIQLTIDLFCSTRFFFAEQIAREFKKYVNDFLPKSYKMCFFALR